MKISLYVKFLLGYIIFGVAAFFAIATLSSRLTYDYLIKYRSATLYDEASLIASTYSTVYEGENIDLASAYPQLEAIATYLRAQIWVMARDGTIIVDSNGQRNGNIVRDFDPTATGNRSYITGNYFGNFSYQVLSVSSPITGNYKTYGYVVIHLPMEEVQKSQYEILNIVYITSLIVFLLSLTIIILFHITVYRPLKAITKAAKEYAGGNLTYRIKLKTHDEMGYLADTMNYMSDELNRSEDYQRSFIANISHDFRSPLTSIKGYLEAILDGTIPQEMHEKYLKRVIDETERLTKLTSGMLTLNSLDNKVYLNRTNFDINRIIKDTAASFEGQCGKKNITLDLTFSDNSIPVFADRGKIEQVLYNLIDNAIKFSHPGSTIFVQAYEKHEKIFISVKDSGVGIAKNEQKKIFERFYKSDSSRGKDKKGTGLGLSIVKEIVQAHDENIDVISTSGVGSEFIFSLPKAVEL